MQNMNRKRGSNAWLREQAKARILLRFGMRVAQRQIECGRLFMFEHPVGAVSWKDRTVVHVSKQDTVQTVRLDQCMVGLRDRVSQKPHMKPTYIMTNSQHIARELSIRCDRSHVHEHVLGSVRVDGVRKARSELSQEYPKEMCRRVVRSLMREKREKEETRVRHSVLVIEQLQDSHDERKIVQVLKRCHENLGHPSQARFIAMLKHARATERCIKLAKGLQCPTCEASTKQRSHRVARHSRAENFNEQLYLDTLEVELPWRKLKLLNIVDEATRFQVLVPLWKGFDVDKVRVAYRRYWKRWAGAPVRALTDGGPEFGEAFTSAMQQDGTWHEVTAAHAPWQNGVCERLGGAWKVAFKRAMLEVVPESKWEVEEVIDQVTNANNTMVRKDGYSPNQHVLGAELRVPSMLMNGGRDEAVGSGLEAGEPAYLRRHAIRQAARRAFVEADDEARLRRAAAHRTRPAAGPLSEGDLVYVWRRGMRELKPHWHGPGRVIGNVGARVWVALGAKVYRCAPEQVRRPSLEQEELSRLLPSDVTA